MPRESNAIINYKYDVCSMKCRRGTVKSTAAIYSHIVNIRRKNVYWVSTSCAVNNVSSLVLLDTCSICPLYGRLSPHKNQTKKFSPISEECCLRYMEFLFLWFCGSNGWIFYHLTGFQRYLNDGYATHATWRTVAQINRKYLNLGIPNSEASISLCKYSTCC